MPVSEQDQAQVNTYFLRAIDSRDWDNMRDAIEAGADAGHDGSLGFQIAAAYNKTDMMNFLARHGATCFGSDNGALRLAVRHNALEAVDLLIDTYRNAIQNDILPGLEEAAGAGQEKVVAKLLPLTAVSDETHGAALYQSAGDGYTGIVNMLLDAGVDPDAADGSALWCSVAGDHVDTVELLLERGADPNDRRKDDLFLEAAQYDAGGVLRLMLERGMGRDVLQEAIETVEEGKTKALLKKAQFWDETAKAGKLRDRVRGLSSKRPRAMLTGARP